MSQTNHRRPPLTVEERLTELEVDSQFMKVNVYYTLRRMMTAVWGLMLGNAGLLLALVWTWWG